MHDNTRPPAPARLIAGPEAAVPVESGKGCRYVNRHIPDWLTVSVVVRVSPMQGVAFWLETQFRTEILTAVIAWGASIYVFFFRSKARPPADRFLNTVGVHWNRRDIRCHGRGGR